MNFLLVLAYGISLSMDAFAVSVCKGLSLGKVRARDCFKVGTYFGIFQGIMPLLGYFLADMFKVYIERFDHWIAFILLLYIGGKMIYDSFHGEEEDQDGALSFGKMITLSVATSIDALAVGIAFCCEGMPLMSSGATLGVFASAFIICMTTFLISAFGVRIGKICKSGLRSRATLIGGAVLILLGVEILVEHVFGFSLL